MSIERTVALLTPVFAALAGLVTTGIGQLAPGVNLNKTDVTALFIAGATAAAAAALKWLHGRAQFTKAVSDADALADHVVAKIQANPVAAPALADIENVLKAHTNQIITAIGSAVHAPASVDQVAEQIAQRLTGQSSTTPPAPSVSTPTQGGAV